MKTISVLMGVYQPAARIEPLRRAVESVLGQTFTDFEFLICDDGSCGEVKTLLEEFAERDSRVRLIRDPTALTLPQKLNLCLRHAAGAYIARQDDDDCSRPERFEKQLMYLQANPDVAFVGCNVTLEMEDGSTGIRSFPERPRVDDFAFSMPFIHPALILRRSALEAVGGYSEDRWCILCEDYDLLLRLYARGLPGANLEEQLFLYHVNGCRRKFRYRFNESVTRWRRFGEARMLPRYIVYVLKPVCVGLIPTRLLERLKFRMGIFRR